MTAAVVAPPGDAWNAGTTFAAGVGGGVAGRYPFRQSNGRVWSSRSSPAPSVAQRASAENP